MAHSGLEMNRFEKYLFWTALLFGAAILAVRLGTVVGIFYLRHIR